MTSGWAAFLGALVGGSITGAFMLVADLLRHRRLKEERVQEMLLSDRVKAYDELSRRLTELWWDLPLTQTGLEPLRWPKDKRISPKFFEGAGPEKVEEEEEVLAKETHRRLEKLKEFMQAHTIILGPRVQCVFWEAFGEFAKWRTMLRTQSDEQLEKLCPDYMEKVEEALNGLRDQTNEAMTQDLAVQGFSALASKQLRVSRLKGSKKVEGYLNVPRGSEERDQSEGARPK